MNRLYCQPQKYTQDTRKEQQTLVLHVAVKLKENLADVYLDISV